MNQLLFFILFLHIHIVSSSEIIKIIKGPVLRELFNAFLLHMIALSFLSHLLEHNLKNSQTFSKEKKNLKCNPKRKILIKAWGVMGPIFPQNLPGVAYTGEIDSPGYQTPASQSPRGM